jgi:L-lactate dehydrogenase complex protein LldE
VLGVTDVGATAQGTLSYHACCHGLRGLGVDGEPKALLAGVRGAATCPLPEAEVCCGFGGLFAVKMSNISGEMLARKLDAIEACGADTIAVTDVSCGMHMNGGLRRRSSHVRVVHIADVLAGEAGPGRPAREKK